MEAVKDGGDEALYHRFGFCLSYWWRGSWGVSLFNKIKYYFNITLTSTCTSNKIFNYLFYYKIIYNECYCTREVIINTYKMLVLFSKQ